MAKELAKQYDPKDVEDRIYQSWIQGNYFHAACDPQKKPYTIVIPPPNITGQLHMGHALDNTLQDILIRWRRMQGFDTLWLPGTDHASIATEAKIVDALRAEGISKEDLGREGFLKRAWEWRAQYGGRIVEQLKKLGSSCDWERERFTLDEGCSKAVREVFNNLYEKGLIYRGERIINWCPHCKTSISDIEMEYEEKDGAFWHMAYPFTDGSGAIIVATTRPETIPGDTGVAVHPDDERYKDMIGKTVRIPVIGREIPIVADTYAKMDKGTGAVKITPAHDPNDFEVGLRCDLPILNVMTDDGYMNDQAGKYAGMSLKECRKAIVADFEAAGALVKIEPTKHEVGTCYRCHTSVEPRVSKQWFVKMQPLAEPAIKVVREGKTKFIPLTRPITTGWKTSATGASPANSGGDTGSRRGIATTAARSPFRAKMRPSAPIAAARTSIRIPIRSTPGSRLRCGRFPPSAGPIKRPNSPITIRPTRSSPVMISSSSGWRA